MNCSYLDQERTLELELMSSIGVLGSIKTVNLPCPHHEALQGSSSIATLFLTSVLNTDKRPISLPDRFTAEKGPRYPLNRESVWGPEPVWAVLEKKYVAVTGIGMPDLAAHKTLGIP